MESLTKRSVDALAKLRASVREIESIAHESTEIDPETVDFDQVGWARFVLKEWLTFENPSGNCLVDWVMQTDDYAASTRYIYPAAGWGLWRRALERWARGGGGHSLPDDLPAPTHTALRVLAGYPAVGRTTFSNADLWAATVRSVRDMIRYEGERRKDSAAFQSELLDVVRAGAERRERRKSTP